MQSSVVSRKNVLQNVCENFFLKKLKSHVAFSKNKVPQSSMLELEGRGGLSLSGVQGGRLTYR